LPRHQFEKYVVGFVTGEDFVDGQFVVIGDASGFQKQMDVVGHQDVSIEGEPIALPVVLKAPEIA
jgi:pyruvate carboxylase